jgi:pre-mRNA-splicing factor SYF2/beta-D-xylosidase 4
MKVQLLCSVVLLGCFFEPGAATCSSGPTTCYIETPARILGNQNVNGGHDGLTLEDCAQLCYNKGNKYAGAEYANQCYCGDELSVDAKVARSASECDMPCSANKTEMCGGDWRVSVLEVSCEGPPDPRPREPARMVNPCLDASQPFSKMPFCNASLPIDVRVQDAVFRMTLAEKIANMATYGAPIPSLGLRRYNWWSEATHGLKYVQNDDRTPYESNFAMPITTAMSFNRSLWLKTGRQIGQEARAFMNAGNAFSTFWAPVINIAREPRWGRNIETPGEDPYLTGEYATHFVQGMEVAPQDPSHIQASACCKHYVANSMDASTVAGVSWNRENFDASVTMQDLVDSYMAPFQACVERGKVSGMMCSYNAVNGVPSCANDWLLAEVARNDWGFDGYITSDCDADADVFRSHHYTSTPEEAVRDVLHAGTDVDCGGFTTAHAQSALDKGLITEADIDERMAKLFRVRMRLSHFDPLGPLDAIPASTICSAYAKALAYDGAAQGSTLLKNVGATLPLDKGGAAPARVAVIGPNANLSASIATYYAGQSPCSGKFWNLVDAVETFAPNTVSALGLPSVLSTNLSGIPAAVAMAKGASTVIMAVGTNLDFAAEGHDAVNVSVPYGQARLVEAVADAAAAPITIVLFTANPLDVSAWMANPKIGAVLLVGQPSVGVLGVANVLFGGKAPAGRTVQTVYPEAYANEISIFDFNMRPGPSAYDRPDCPREDWGKCEKGTNPGRTHRFYTGTPVVPFGFGLSYTTFNYSHAAVRTNRGDGSVSLRPVREVLAQSKGSFVSLAAVDAMAPLVQYSVKVTNTGAVDADDVVLGFLVPPGAGKGGVPLQTLFGFDRVHVRAGETVTVDLYPQATDFMITRENGNKTVVEGEYKVRFGIPEALDHGMGFLETTLTAHL